MDTFMENSAPSNVWTYYARWHCYFASLIETNVSEISCLPRADAATLTVS